MKVLMYDVSNLLFRMMSVGLKMNEKADGIEKLIRVESVKAQYIVAQSEQNGKNVLEFFNVTESARKVHSSLKTEKPSFTVDGEITETDSESLFKINANGTEDAKKVQFAQEMGKLSKQKGVKVEFLLDINGIMYSVKESIKKDVKDYGKAGVSPIYCFDSKNWRQAHLTEYYAENANRISSFVNMGMSVSAPIYKDGRPDKNQNKIRQLILEFTKHLEATNQTIVKKVGFEADDLLVYMAKEIEQLNKEADNAGFKGEKTAITIVSADKDIGVNASSENTRVYSPNTKRLFSNNPVTIAANYCELMFAGDKIDAIEPAVPETIIDINGAKIDIGVSFKKDGIKTVLADYVEESLSDVKLAIRENIGQDESEMVRRHVAELLVQKKGHGFANGNDPLIVGYKKTATGTSKKMSVVEEKFEYEGAKEIASSSELEFMIEQIKKSDFSNKEVLEKKFKAHLSSFITDKYVTKYLQTILENVNPELAKKWLKLSKKVDGEVGKPELLELEKEFSDKNPSFPKRDDIKKSFNDVLSFYLKINEDVIDINRMPKHIKGDMIKYVDQVLPNIMFSMTESKKTNGSPKSI